MSSPLIDDYDGVLFDLDGVLYTGAEAVEGAVEAAGDLRRRGVGVGFVTNNASRSSGAVAEHLSSLGIRADEEEVFGSATAGVALLREHLAPGSTVLVVGSEHLRGQVSAAGFAVVESAVDAPEAVIQGFSPDVGWRNLAEASFAVNDGARWFATNLDVTLPRDRGIAPGNGSLIEAITRATGRRPLAAGKPEPMMFLQAAEALGMHRPLVVGDRLDTDILGGNRAGFDTALVLTGIHTETDVDTADEDMRPHHILTTLADMFRTTVSRA
ncbi:MAG: HAD-IIA family hydrolase [Nesterenkonia sp.]|nr:HAD-IIA family hydrolase [Nesterenkonia sp.]